MSITVVPKGILTKIKKINFHYLWSGSHQAAGIPLVKWNKVASPKELGDGDLRKFTTSQATHS
jgi:hypothetical protein